MNKAYMLFSTKLMINIWRRKKTYANKSVISSNVHDQLWMSAWVKPAITTNSITQMLSTVNILLTVANSFTPKAIKARKYN